MRVSLDGIETLDAIVRCGSFQAAAVELHKAQSAVSYTVRQLEQALGVTLFDRSGHRAVLTPEGVAVLDEGRFLLSRARRIEGLAERFATGWEPRLEVVIDGVLPMAPVVRALKQLGDEGVPTHIQITMAFLGGVQQRFERDDAHLMIGKDVTPGPWLQTHGLPDEVLVLVAAAGHPAVQVSEPHDGLSLQRHLELSVHDSRQETRGTDTNDVGGARVFYLSDFRTKRDALKMGLGFGWMPYRLVAGDLASGTLAVVPYQPGSRRVFTPWLAHRTDRVLGRAAQRLMDLVVSGWPPTEG